MALAGDILKGLARGVASSSASGRQALRLGQEERATEQRQQNAVVDRLVNLRQLVPNGSPEAQELDAKIGELAPELATERTTAMAGEGEPEVADSSLVRQDPQVAASQAESQRNQALRRSVAAQVQRMKRLPEDVREGMTRQAMLSDDPEGVLKDAREMGRVNVKSAEGAFSEQLQNETGQGNFVAVRTDQGLMRQTRDDQGNIQFVTPPGDIQLVGTSQTGTPEELGLSGSEETALRDQEVAARNFVDTTNQALQMLQENPDVNTFSARAGAVVNDLQQEGKALARASGLEIEDGVFDTSNYESSFDNLGIQSERMKSLFVSLAFQAATASGQTGRSVSDKDVERFMQQVGQQSSDPRALSQVLRDTAERTVNNFRNSYRTRRGEQFQGDLGVSQLPTIESGESGQFTRDNPAEPQTKQEYDALPSGAYFRDDEGLKRKP